MKFNKSKDGKRRATIQVEYRVGHEDLLATACAMVAHNELQDFLDVYGPEVMGTEHEIKPKLKLTRLAIIDHLKSQYRIGCDIGDIGEDFESQCGYIAWILNNKTNPAAEFTTEDVCADVEKVARKAIRKAYPELTRTDEANA